MHAQAKSPRIALPPLIDGAAVLSRMPKGVVTRLSGETMGTCWRVSAVVPAGVGDLRGPIMRRLAAIVGEMSHWDTASDLCRFNRAAAGKWVDLPTDFARVMTAALAIAEASGGAFSPALGRLVDLGGFGPPGPVYGAPEPKVLAAAHAGADWRRLALADAPARLRQPGELALDLSGIAKGFAVDALAEMLTARGVAHFAVEVGGEWCGAGVQPDGQPWWVVLETPPGADLAPLHAALHGLSVATSGGYVRGAHTLDPRTGRPAANGVIACSVLQPSAMMADGWASALVVLGAEAGLALATRLGLAARLVVAQGTGCREHLTPPLVAMLDG